MCGLGPLAWAGGSRRRAGEGARSEENCGDTSSVKGKLSVDLNLGHNLEPHRPHREEHRAEHREHRPAEHAPKSQGCADTQIHTA